MAYVGTSACKRVVPSMGSMPQPRVESPPKLSLRTLYVALVEGLIFTRARVRILGMGMKRC